MNIELLMALLSLDSYNRGYAPGMEGPSNSGMSGQARFLPNRLPASSPAAGFYAAAYDISAYGYENPDAPGSTLTRVLSFRGTDKPNGDISTDRRAILRFC